MKYKAVLFAPDGDWITDCKGDTKDEVIEAMANLGSRWYFYPIALGIILDKGSLTRETQRLVDVAPNIPRVFVGKSIRTARKWLQSLTKKELHNLVTGG